MWLRYIRLVMGHIWYVTRVAAFQAMINCAPWFIDVMKSAAAAAAATLCIAPPHQYTAIYMYWDFVSDPSITMNASKGQVEYSQQHIAIIAVHLHAWTKTFRPFYTH